MTDSGKWSNHWNKLAEELGAEVKTPPPVSPAVEPHAAEAAVSQPPVAQTPASPTVAAPTVAPPTVAAEAPAIDSNPGSNPDREPVTAPAPVAKLPDVTPPATPAASTPPRAEAPRPGRPATRASGGWAQLAAAFGINMPGMSSRAAAPPPPPVEPPPAPAASVTPQAPPAPPVANIPVATPPMNVVPPAESAPSKAASPAPAEPRAERPRGDSSRRSESRGNDARSNDSRNNDSRGRDTRGEERERDTRRSESQSQSPSRGLESPWSDPIPSTRPAPRATTPSWSDLDDDDDDDREDLNASDAAEPKETPSPERSATEGSPTEAPRGDRKRRRRGGRGRGRDRNAARESAPQGEARPVPGNRPESDDADARFTDDDDLKSPWDVVSSEDGAESSDLDIDRTILDEEPGEEGAIPWETEADDVDAPVGDSATSPTRRRRRRRRGGRKGERLTRETPLADDQAADGLAKRGRDAGDLDHDDELVGEDELLRHPLGDDEEASEDALDSTGESTEADSEDRPRRRRRRRRGGRRRGNKETAEAGTTADAEAPEGEAPDGDWATDEERPARRPRREARPVQDVAANGAASRAAAEADDDHHDLDLDEDGDHHGHKGIPSWEEAIGTIIATNMEARAKNPNGGGGFRGRPRGGRGRGRPNGGR